MCAEEFRAFKDCVQVSLGLELTDESESVWEEMVKNLAL